MNRAPLPGYGVIGPAPHRPQSRVSRRPVAAAWLAFALCNASLAHATATPPTPGQDPAVIEQLVSKHLRERAAELPGVASISVEAQAVRRFPACSAPSAFLSANSRLRARMSVGVRCNDPATSWTTYVQVGMQIKGSYPVATSTINPGELISDEHLTMRQGDLLGLQPGTVLVRDQAIGHTATRRITAGQPLRTTALRDARSVVRGQAVRLVIHGTGFVASGEGRATATAAPGSSVQVRTASGQLVSGIVRDATTVEVSM